VPPENEPPHAVIDPSAITAWGEPSNGGTTPAPNLANTAGADQIAFIGSAITDITFSNSGGTMRTN
jgi:hypothetical protein